MQARADRTRRLILQAAAERFEARGYVGTHLSDIVRGRGISKGALYFHFPSKEALATAILEEQLGLVPSLADELRDRRRSAIQVLVDLSLRTTEMLRDDVAIRAGTRLACEFDRIGTPAPPLLPTWTDAVEDLLTEAREQGDLLPDVEVRSVAEVIVATVGVAGRKPSRPVEGWTVDHNRRIRAMWRHMFPGLVTPVCAAKLTPGLAPPGPPL
ncbi:TetR/AcrR family transcriptional regulator [Actinomadura sp. KC06]|uniref:ScbR family autoregulator-binding transcription factor n=1 Tax=Actinomadura sp. KC06 TaxID=2530369 RepID=UPI0010515B3A|nr:ScbR family autoregulator-binding transcription factor [Actinomadura sp. KC06]TDD35506.1 TetR/AcrR family transcriptional regulator [Actinomadura sp. KC06]